MRKLLDEIQDAFYEFILKIEQCKEKHELERIRVRRTKKHTIDEAKDRAKFRILEGGKKDEI